MEDKIQYILTDLDGTLLRPDATLSPYAEKVVTEALERGHVISYATARSYTSSKAIVGAVACKYPMVLYNGALLYDPVEGKKLAGAFLDLECTNALIQLGKSYGLCPLLFALDEEDQERVLHEPLERSGDRQFLEGRPNDQRFREIAQLQCPEQFQVLSLTYIGHQEELLPLMEAVRNAYRAQVHIHFLPDAYITDHYFLELSHRRANKRDGLILWTKHVGCKPEEVIVFGDNLNDIGLFEAAGFKVVVSSAQPRLKELADLIIEANTEDGVARCVELMIDKREICKDAQ